MPIVAGAGAGAGLCAQALRPSEATANAATAANLTNFMNDFPLLSLLVAVAIKAQRDGETMKFAAPMSETLRFPKNGEAEVSGVGYLE